MMTALRAWLARQWRDWRTGVRIIRHAPDAVAMVTVLAERGGNSGECPWCREPSPMHRTECRLHELASRLDLHNRRGAA